MDNAPLVSVITSFYNSEKFLADAIESIIDQSYANWELILVNDGSTDDSSKIALSYNDHRIRYFEKKNGGVSSGRNVGLDQMRGEYFCFLDADDRYTKRSIESRIIHFETNPQCSYVDGKVSKRNQDLSKEIEVWVPAFKGQPFEDLLKLTGKSFFGPSWMVRRVTGMNYRFQEGLTHCEDLLFYLEISHNGGIYDYVKEEILLYRVHNSSAMCNIDGLTNGYKAVQKWLKYQNVGKSLENEYRARANRIITRSYLRAMRPLKAVTKRLS